MFPFLGAQSISYPMANNGMENVYLNSWYYPNHNHFPSSDAILNTSGQMFNTHGQSNHQEQQVRTAYPGFEANTFLQNAIPNEMSASNQHPYPLFIAPFISEQSELPSQIKSEARECTTDHEPMFVCEMPSGDSSTETNVTGEKDCPSLKGTEAKIQIPPEIERKPIICSFCGGAFNDIDDLQEHLPTHKNVNTESKVTTESGKEQSETGHDQPFSCNMCSCKFPCATDLRIHLFYHSGKTPTCEICHRTFQLRKHLKVHMLSHEKTPKFKCDICEYSFRHKLTLQRHIDRFHNVTASQVQHLVKEEIEDQSCKYVVQTEGQNCTYVVQTTKPKERREKDCKYLNENGANIQDSPASETKSIMASTEECEKQGQADQDQQFSCNMCPCKFPSASRLRIHQFCHTGKTPTCEICQRTFERRKNLKIHMMSHEDIRNFTCGICTKDFRDAQTLKRHIARIHSGKVLKCDSCFKVFVKEMPFKLHSARCQEQRRLMLCHKCGQLCENKSFIEHLKTHSSAVIGYTCELCDEVLPHAQSLKIHVMKHKGFSPQRCDQCDIEFLRKSALQKHLDTHNGVKRYECKECGKKYSTKTTLQDHMNMHTGSRPYKCSLCHRGFPSYRNKIRHEKLHEKGFQRIRKESIKKNKVRHENGESGSKKMKS